MATPVLGLFCQKSFAIWLLGLKAAKNSKLLHFCNWLGLGSHNRTFTNWGGGEADSAVLSVPTVWAI